MSFKNIAVVILNYNGRHYLEKFLPKVVSLSADSQVIVIDNASSDDSVIFLKTYYPRVGCIILDRNYGFCGGYNRGLQQVEAKYYVLLNSDVEVTPNWLKPLFDTLEKNPNMAACQPKIKDYYKKDFFEYAGAAGGYLDLFGYPLTRGRVLSTIERDLGQYDNQRLSFWASGACLFIRADLYNTFGGFDELFFAHMEEIDLCWRLQQQGYTVSCVPLSQVYHVGGGTLNQDSPRKVYFNFRNNLMLLLKNLPLYQAFIILSIRLILDGAAALCFIFQGRWSYFIVVIKAHFSFYRHIRYLIKKRPSKLKPIQQLNGIYKGSVIWVYFARKKKKFLDLVDIN